jgi:glycerate 2-kinase
MTLASDALAIARSGVRAVDPGESVRRVLHREGRRLVVGRHRGRLTPDGRVHVVAIGKAAGAMMDAAFDVLGRETHGVAFTPTGYPAPRSKVPVSYGNHPVPGAESFEAGARLLRYVRTVTEDDSLLYLISGGGSAVAEVPAAGLTPEDIAATTRALLASGAPISEMNAIRRHISMIKGGQLATAGRAGWFATIALSDVVGDPPSDIASGPTVGDPSTFRDAMTIVRRRHLDHRLPRRVLSRLRAGARGRLPETPRPSDPRLRRAPFVLAASNRVALAAAAVESRRRGYRTRVLSSQMVGETQPTARRFARKLLAAAAPRPVALLAGGETTVTLGRHPGRGGRNQEFALAVADLIAGRAALVLSVGTDGIDGPTDAAGGYVDGRATTRAKDLGIDLGSALARHASYDVLEQIGGLVRTGPTGTNVMDLHIGLIRGETTPGTVRSSRPGAAPSSRRRRS